MSQALRKLAGAVNKSKTVLIFINQIRMKIGVMFGNPETTSGGNALKFYASVRLEIRKVESIKQGQDVVGNRVRVKVIKNKVASPYRTAEFDIMFNEGISKEGNLIDVGLSVGVLRKSGSFIYLDDERLGQGRENAKEYLRQNPDVAEEIESRIKAAGNLDKVLIGSNGGLSDIDV